MSKLYAVLRDNMLQQCSVLEYDVTSDGDIHRLEDGHPKYCGSLTEQGVRFVGDCPDKLETWIAHQSLQCFWTQNVARAEEEKASLDETFESVRPSLLHLPPNFKPRSDRPSKSDRPTPP